jgi:hypothetical protein
MSGGEAKTNDGGNLSSWGPTTPQPKTFLRRFRWLLIAGGVVVLLFLLVVLAPTLASMGWAKSIILGKVNDQLNGSLVAKDWDLNWFGGLELSEVRLYDKNKVQLAEMKRLKTELSVWDVVFGDMYNLGKTKVEGLAVNFKRFGDGTTNFSDLAKKTTVKKPGGEEETVVVVPDIKGEFDIDFRGTLEQQDKDGKWQTVIIDPSRAKVKVPNINATLPNDVDIQLRSGDGATGKFAASGSVKLFEKNKFDPEKLDHVQADETVEIVNVPLAAALPFLDPSSINKLAGSGNSKLAVKMAGVDDLTVEGNLTVDNLAVGGPKLQGDSFEAKKFLVEIPHTTFATSTKRIKTGQSAASTPILVRFDDNSISVAIDAPIEALKKLAKNERPGADGQVTANVDLKMAALAQQLPHMLDLPEGVKIESGNLKQTLNLTLTPDKAVIKQSLDLADLRGTHNGQAIAPQPIHLTFEGSSLGGGGAIPDLRNFIIGLTSGFAQINGTGESLAKHHVDGTVDLDKAKKELGPFSAFLNKAKLAGQVQFKLDTAGDLLKHDQNPQMDASLTGRGLVIENVAAHPIREDWIEASAKGNLVFEETVLKAIRGATATIKTSKPQEPSVDMSVAGDIQLAPFAVPNFDIKPSKIDLHAVQQEFAAFIPPDKVEFSSGTIAFEGKGKLEGDAMVLTSLSVNPQNLTLVQNKKTVLENYTGTLQMVGDVRQETKDKKSTIAAKLTKLSLSDQKNLLTIEKAGDGDLVFNLQPDGSFSGSGKLAIKNADLKKLKDIADAASGAEAPQAGEATIESGNLAGTVELQTASKDQTAIAGDLQASNLTIGGAQNMIRNETISLSVRANADNKFSLIDLGRLDVKSKFMDVLLSETVIRRPVGGGGGPPLDMVQKAQMVMNVPDLAKAHALVMAFIPESETPQPATTTKEKAPAPAPRAAPAPRVRASDIGEQRISSGPQKQPAEPAAKAEGPLTIQGGSAKGTVVISRPGNALKIEVQDLAGQKLELRRGAGRFGPKDILLNLAVQIQQIANADAAKPISEQIQDVQITKLDGNLAITEVHLEEPIVLKNLNSNLEANGAIRAKGDIEPLTDFLEVMGFVAPGSLNDYHGSYVLTQKVGSKGDGLSATGQINITDLKIGSTVHPQFAERLLAVNNEVSLDQKAKVLTINNLALNMQDSKALEVVIKNGKIEDYEKSRKFNDLKMLLSYDAAKVWAIVKPMLSEEQQKNFADMRVAGVVNNREFMITGSYPAETKKDRRGQEINPLEYTTVQGSVYLNQFEYQGMLAENLEVPLYFNKGILQTIYKDKPDNQYAKPAKYSGGTIDLSGLSIDVLADHPRVTALRKNYPLLENVEIRREFVDAYLGKASPWFTGAEDARGKMTVIVKDLDRLPLDEALTKPKKKEVGKGSVTFSITDLRLKPPMLAIIGPALNLKTNSDGSISADIKDAQVGVENGKVDSDITLNFGGQPLRNKGVVQMSNDHIVNMTMYIPKTLLGRIPGVADTKLIKDVVEVPVGGDLRRPQVDIGQAVIRQLNPADLLENLIPGAGKSKPPGIVK